MAASYLHPIAIFSVRPHRPNIQAKDHGFYNLFDIFKIKLIKLG